MLRRSHSLSGIRRCRRKKALGADHPDLATTLSSLALLFKNQVKAVRNVPNISHAHDVSMQAEGSTYLSFYISTTRSNTSVSHVLLRSTCFVYVRLFVGFVVRACWTTLSCRADACFSPDPVFQPTCPPKTPKIFYYIK